MARIARERSLTAQLRVMLDMAGADPKRWVFGTIGASLVLAALDTLGVAAMVPLTQLFSGETDNWFTQSISDALGTTEISSIIPVMAGIITIVFIVKSIGAILFRWWLLGRTTKISALSAAELARRYALAPYADHRSRRISEIYRNINDATGQAAAVLLNVVSLVSDIVVLLGIVVVLLLTSVTVTIFAVVLFGVLVFGVQMLLRRRQYRLGEEVAAAGLEAWQFLLPGLDGFREARLTSSANAFIDGFRAARLRRARAARVMGILSDAPRYLLEIGFVVAILGISIILFTTGTPAEALTVLGVFAAASLRALPGLNRIGAGLATIRTGRAGLDIISKAVDELAAGGVHDERPRSTERFSGDIVLRDLGFHYPDTDEHVLQGISLELRENRTTAFVGSSGAGKSTLLDIVLGLLQPTEGEVLVGGRSIAADPASWYAELGVVPQDVFLLNSTLTTNIAFGVPAEDIELDRVHEVIRMAQLEALVADLPEGLETVVGERGVRLSGGQRQRIGLARALYRRPRVLVLDEATSALDNVTEHEIAQTLGALQGSLTILIVAHRLSTVRHADTLVFLKGGRVDAEGTFDDVRATNADFARLVELGELD
ncbi:ABC transporter ATP-binding protein [Agromyces marinus]|uniref:ABC transporter ATP-binding protein n=1 Tax=Agromyces marinus TaxID=1389020 RepID=A0ABN6YBY7_9MICO|nr:ABC transporter ATP-binding protein [Agromyces marinus]UIP60001.1 Protein glycosylation K [Agromyces marinus]BDZ54892.1 ABC transporter ATP-binding protein [Agromyces marinus]